MRSLYPSSPRRLAGEPVVADIAGSQQPFCDGGGSRPRGFADEPSMASPSAHSAASVRP